MVTPSSPRKSANEPRSSSSPPVQLFDTEGGRGRTGSRSKSSSRIPRKFNSANSSLIGLGLPGELPRTSSFNDDRPPPVPEKSQSVSSPLPSRTASPVPEIAFTEPERVREKADGSSIKQVEEGRRGRVKRSHSLSGIVSQPANVLNTDHSDAVASDAPEANGETPVDTSETGSTKAHGVLGWLGVRRTIKRRQSESRIKKDDGSEGDSKTSAKPDTKDISGNQEKVKSRESLGLDAELLQIEKTPRRPELRTESSGGTVMPQAAPGKLASLFTRRASSEATEFTEPIESTLQVTPVALPAEARAIHNAILRNSTAGSSQSSLTLPPSEPAFSPFMIPQSDTWITSPTTDAEEMLYSPSGSSRWGPGIRPWVDSAISGNGSNRSSMSSPLGSMPEQGILDLTSAPKLLTNVREGRVRSWSDASILQPNRPAQSSSSHLPINPDDPSISRSLQPSPLTPTRPKLDGRASSGNSAIMGRMRTVFSRSGSRSRANSLLRQRSSDTDEFGRLSADVWPRGIRMRPSFSSSSDVASSRLSVQDDLPYVSLLGLEGGSPNPSTETSRRSPTSSPGPSILPTVTASNRQPVEKDLRAHQRINRPRASTLSTGASITSFVGPPSPGLFPTAATPPRRRPSVIHRVSNGRFGSDPSSPKASASLFPLPPRFTGTPVIAGALTHGDAGMTSQVTSPRPSFGSIAAAMDSSVIKQVAKRQDEETPEMWSNRVAMKISRAEIAGVLTAR